VCVHVCVWHGRQQVDTWQNADHSSSITNINNSKSHTPTTQQVTRKLSHANNSNCHTQTTRLVTRKQLKLSHANCHTQITQQVTREQLKPSHANNSNCHTQITQTVRVIQTSRLYNSPNTTPLASLYNFMGLFCGYIGLFRGRIRIFSGSVPICFPNLAYPYTSCPRRKAPHFCIKLSRALLWMYRALLRKYTILLRKCTTLLAGVSGILADAGIDLHRLFPAQSFSLHFIGNSRICSVGLFCACTHRLTSTVLHTQTSHSFIPRYRALLRK